MNVSILDILQGVCSIYSGSILLSNFTWDESDGGGKNMRGRVRGIRGRGEGLGAGVM